MELNDLVMHAETLQRKRRFVEAERAYREALGRGADARVMGNYAGVLNELCEFGRAEQICRRAVALDPACWGAWSNLGCTLVETQRYDAAVLALRECLRINGCHVEALSNLGLALRARGDVAQAVTMLELASQLQPANAEVRCNLAQARIASGDFRRGFAEFEARWQTQAKRLPCEWPVPRWRGEDFSGRTILIHEEDGFGDTLQFIRFASIVKQRGGHVVVMVRRELVRLLGRLPYIDDVVEPGAPLPRIDLQCPLLSLPAILGTCVETVPFAHGYLAADYAGVRRWQEVVGRNDASVRIGLVWAGSPRHTLRDASLVDRRRSMAIACLAPLADAVPGAVFYSLQKGEAAGQTVQPPAGMRLVDHSARLEDFDETAALIMALDVVVAVDTATAHLAGALGRPVLMLSRYDQCWRWLVGRDDTPWYRTMRLYRQPSPGDWATPLETMARDLNARLWPTGGALDPTQNEHGPSP